MINIKTKNVTLFLTFIILLFLILASFTTSNLQYIVIDPGHGGIDGGCTKDGYLEKDLNLKASLILANYFKTSGYRVYLTRDQDTMLAKTKTKDMEQRLKIINNPHTLLFLSIHVNSFPDPLVKGAQVFYGSDEGKMLATSIQNNLTGYHENTRLARKINNKFLTTYAKTCGCIVELGFISNQEDLKILTTDKLNELCMLVYLGTLEYLNN